MPITLTAETGAGLYNANAYCTVEEANTFNNERPFATAWLAIGVEDKKRSIIMATRLLDEHVDWHGQSVKSHNLSMGASSRQSLNWPRSGVSDTDGYGVDQESIPQFLKDATSEMARFVALDDRTLDPATQGFQQITLGSLNLQIDSGDKAGVLPRGVIHMIAPYGNPRFSSVSKLVRV